MLQESYQIILWTIKVDTLPDVAEIYAFASEKSSCPARLNVTLLSDNVIMCHGSTNYLNALH